MRPATLVPSALSNLTAPTLVIVLAFLAMTGSAGATTWFVNSDGTGDAPTIQAAVDSSVAGDEILVGPGTYGEEVTIPHALTLRGQLGAESTTIDAQGTRAHCVRYTGGAGTGPDIEGLTFTGVNSGYGFCTGVSALSVSPAAGSIEISDCIFRHNYCAENHAPLEGSGVLFLTNTQFLNNAAGYSCGGIDPGNGAGAVDWSGLFVFITGCTFDGNLGSTTGAIRFEGVAGQLLVAGCRFQDHFSLYGGGLFTLVGPSNEFGVSQTLFVDNEGMPYFDTMFPQGTVSITTSTFARNSVFFAGAPPPFPPGSIVRRNVFSGATVGLALPNGGAGITVECNDSWGNMMDWSGFDPSIGPDNFSQQPNFCDAANHDFTVASNSPLLATNSPCNLQIGAFGQGCGPVSIEATSWGRIKSLYRSAD